MCASSRILQRKLDDWQTRFPRPRPLSPRPRKHFVPDEEVQTFRRDLEDAREFDVRTHQPECEQDEKRRRLLELAHELGVDISFV